MWLAYTSLLLFQQIGETCAAALNLDLMHTFPLQCGHHIIIVTTLDL